MSGGDIDAVRPPEEPAQQEQQPPTPGKQASQRMPAQSFGEMLIGSMAVSVLLLTGGLAVGFEPPKSDGQAAEAAPEAVLGATEPRPAPAPSTPAPPVTATTMNPLVAYLATSTTSTTTTTTTTAPPSTTTSTTSPAPIAPASATVTAPGVTLALDVAPADGVRSLQARLSARFEDARVLRAVRVDFGDGTVLPGDVQPWECGAPGAPNPYELMLPAHTYGSPGTYAVTVVATTATCSPDDDDWGPEAHSEVRLSVVAP